MLLLFSLEEGNGVGEDFFFFLAFCRVFVELLIFNLLNDAVFESILCFKVGQDLI